MILQLGRVAAVHPEDNSIDVVIVESGVRLSGVQVLAQMASTNTGMHDLAAPGVPGSGDVWSLTERTERDMHAVIGNVGGTAVALGFLFPQVNGVLFAEPRRVVRHQSDWYSTVDRHGNWEVCHPGGAYLRMGVGRNHEDLTGKDVDKRWAIKRNTDKSATFCIDLPGGASIEMKPNGNIIITSTAVTIDAPTTTLTGNLHVDGDVTTDGTIVAQGNVTGDGVSLNSHVHGGVDPGSGESGPPA